MSNINKEYIEEYIREIIPKRTELIQSLEEYAKENHVPIIHLEVAEFLKVLIKIKKAKNILEIGSAIGYSAIIMASSMDNGSLTSIERREDMVNLAKSNIEKSGLERVNIIHGEAQEVLPNIKQKFDFIFIDAAKGKYMEFLPFCIDMLEENGVIVSDNVLFKGMVANDDLVVRRKKTIVRRMREYLDYISNHPRLTTSVIPIGDGMAISYKEDDK
ncbi:O-methyltransferase [Clostridium sp. D2Q-11]|uniref:tRNA 5-hydroxyuridine methyltransferase n=1 Tax=Anaeromonas frigoriresistens TaxID=2683708 RepID=A0A942V195_9FIRM|nr:O-methyltransferase [Anaeromonas frigoriresistens]MBS4540031.1 O-methyltransferase [Anaeromonas frigoriresistens]